jgi:hypothetical protein
VAGMISGLISVGGRGWVDGCPCAVVQGVPVTRSRSSVTVWLYHRLPLSLREVEEIMMERGVVVTYQTIWQWCRKFGQTYANGLRRRRLRPGDKWHLDEVFIKIRGKIHYLWRAVDQDGNVLDILVTSRRDAKAATSSFRKLLRGFAVRAGGAGHRQAGQLRGGPPAADAQCGAPPVELSEQPGRELRPPTDPATGTSHETLHLTRTQRSEQ